MRWHDRRSHEEDILGPFIAGRGADYLDKVENKTILLQKEMEKAKVKMDKNDNEGDSNIDVFRLSYLACVWILTRRIFLVQNF